MGLFSAIAGGIGLIKAGKKLWYKIKKPVPKVQVQSTTGQIVGSTYAMPSYQSINQGSLPTLPSGMQTVSSSSSAPPAFGAPYMAALPVPQGQSSGGLPWWKGPGGKLQLPWNDPRVPAFLKSFALDDSALRVYYRAPKGYVVVRDPSGKPYAVLKSVARSFGLWKPARKPPISATDWKNFKRNQAIEKKLKKIVPARLRTRKVVEVKKGRK